MLKLPRSKNGSPIPAYSQSMIRIRVAVVDEVRVEQVVVARPQLERIGQQRDLDPPADGRRQVVLERDDDAAGQGQGPVGVGDAERDEQARDRRAVVDPPEGVGDAAERLRPVDGLVGDRRPDDEPRDEVALGADERGDLRTDARRRPPRRSPRAPPPG